MTSLAPGTLLVATPMLEDPNFHRSVVFIAEHGPQGSLGLIINRPLTIDLGDLWEACPESLRGLRCCAQGGPVEPDRGLLIHGFARVTGATPFGPGSWVGGDIPQLCRLAVEGLSDTRPGPRLYLGHAGWEGGQLAGEIAQGAWLVRPGRPFLLTDRGLPDDLWLNCIIAGKAPPQPALN